MDANHKPQNPQNQGAARSRPDQPKGIRRGMGALPKADLIDAGLMKMLRDKNPNEERSLIYARAMVVTTRIIGQLTSSAKEERERAKNEVRNLVKLGEEAMKREEGGE